MVIPVEIILPERGKIKAPIRFHPSGCAIPLIDPDQGAQRLRVHLSVIQPGQRAHSPHSHDGEELILLLEGKAIFTLGNEEYHAEGLTSMYCPPGMLHGIRNVGETPIQYLIIRYDV